MPGILSKITSKIKEQGAIKKKQPWELMVIPFAKEPPKIVSKEDRLSFKLLTTPSDPESITYDVKTYAFNDGSPEEWLEHVKTYRKITTGQNITNGAPAFAMLKQLLKGKALTVFERIKIDEAYTNSMDNVEKMLDKLTEEIFPERALQKQRRGLRRYVRKPEGMKTSTFYVRLVEMNEQLKTFPGGDEDSNLGGDKIKEILEFVLPKTWRVHMTLSQFKCNEKTPKEILDFCREIEGIESEHGSLAVAGVRDNRKPQTTKTSTKTSRKRKRDSEQNDSFDTNKRGKKYCPIHGYCAHSAEQCTSLKDTIAKGKRQYTNKLLELKKNKPSGKDKSFSKEEVAVMISSACKTAVNRALSVHRTATTSSKRKVQFHAPEGDITLDTKDIQQQVDALKLYRDSNAPVGDDSSDSSSESES